MVNSRFNESAKLNTGTFIQYYNRLMELSTSMFEWTNVPDTLDIRFLEMALFMDGKALFFEDEVLGFLGLKCMLSGKHNVYGIPTRRRAYAINGYSNNLTKDNSVLIYNNYLRTNSMLDVEMFARRLYNLDRAIDVNANAQKTPILIQCDENQRLTMENVYQKYDGNQPVIFGDKNLTPNSIKVMQTGAPFVADKLYELKTQIWNEALTYLGISNINITKKERLITDEVSRNQGGTIASRYSRLEMRKQACKEINNMFGLNMDCEYREDTKIPEEEIVNSEVNENE